MAAVSVRDVAALAGVSVGTVSNVLNNPQKVSEETAARVQRAIEMLGFVRNDVARHLRAGHSRTIGLVVLDLSNPFFTSLARGAEEAAERANCALLVGNSDQSNRRENSYLDLFDEQRMRGVLISPAGDVSARLRRLRDRGTPAVLVDRHSGLDDYSSVSVDDVAGGRLAARHLIDQGARRLCFVGGPFEITQVADRHQGAAQAVRETPGISMEVLTMPQLTVLQGRAAGEAIRNRPRSEWPDAIFAANDLLAVGVLQAFVVSGVRVPEDILLMGYDDIDFASSAMVPITSIRQPSALIGETAVELVLEEAREGSPTGRQVVFQPEIVVRGSTAVA